MSDRNLHLEKSTNVRVERLKKRADFLKLNGKRKFVTPSMVLLADRQRQSSNCRLGFTVTKKLGNAVIRNRIRRRLKEAARLTFPEKAVHGYDYVMIARPLALDKPFDGLMEEMRFALSKLHKDKAA